MQNELKFDVADYGMDVWKADVTLNSVSKIENRADTTAIRIPQGKRCGGSFATNFAVHRLGMDLPAFNAEPELSMKCASAFGKDYIWFPMRATRDIPFDDYCRRANGFVKAAASYNIQGALHNHLGARVESPEELDAFMKAVPGAMLLLDTGHLAGAGGDCVEFIDRYFDRLAAIHFKDVFIKDASIGLERWGERLRFCEIGGGNIGLDFKAIGAVLRKKNYAKWALVEHDTHLREPILDLKVSLNVLKESLL